MKKKSIEKNPTNANAASLVDVTVQNYPLKERLPDT